MMTNLLYTMLTSTVLMAAPPTHWKSVTPDGGRCKIAFPNEPNLQRIPEDAANGRGEMFAYTAGDTQDKEGFALMWNDFPAMAGKEIPAEVKVLALDRARDGWAKATGGKILSQRKLKLGTHPGVEFTLEMSSSKLMKVRLFLVDNRLYQLGVQGPEEVAQGESATAFFDSFRLLRK